MTARDRRAVVVGTIVVAGSWFALRGAPRAATWARTTEAATAQRSVVVERARQRLTAVPDLADSLASFSELAESLPTILLVGGDEATATVDLMRRVRQIIEARPASLIGFDRRPAERQEGPLSLVSVGVDLETDLAGLLSIIDSIEIDRSLATEALDLRALDPHADRATAERLIAQLTVSAWYQPVEELVVPTESGGS